MEAQPRRATVMSDKRATRLPTQVKTFLSFGDHDVVVMPKVTYENSHDLVGKFSRSVIDIVSETFCKLGHTELRVFETKKRHR